MRLNKLEIKGFKSFRDKTVLEFPDNLTAVVGPNGSGKSNITEAICFVLGRSRGLRAGNLQELIYNGGVSDKPAEKAVVAIELSDKDGGRHRIMRIVDKEGRSTYSLNDRRVTRTRILDLVGDNEYNIILQDDVTKIIEMKSTERRGVIDGICGIEEYNDKKAKAIKELEKVETRINETHIVLGEKQGYMNELKKERDEALDYQKTRDEIKKHEASITHKNIKGIEKRNEKLNEDIEGLKNTKDGDNKRIAELRQSISQGNQELKNVNAAIISMEEEKSRQRILELNGEVGRKEDHRAMLNEKLSTSSESKAKRNARRQLLEEEGREIQAKRVRLDEDVKKKTSEIEEESKLSSDLKLEQEIDSVTKEVYGMHSQARTLRELNNSDQRTLEDLAKEEEQAKETVKKLSEKTGDVGASLNEQKSRNSALKDRISENKRQLEEIQATVRETQETLDKTRLDAAEKKAKLRALEQASQGLKSAIAAVLKIKDVVPGIHGPVFQLGRVARGEYETPLQIAAGDRMQSIVVENVDVAGKCIDYLRKKEVGRATFLPMDRIKAEAIEKPPKESLGFARDFIKTDERYAAVFRYVFGDTILVKDINDAKKIGIGRWRMVTLDGDLFETSGALTGGYTKRIEIGFSNIDEQEKEIAGLEADAMKQEGRMREMQDAEAKIKNTLVKMEMDYSEGRMAENQLSFEEKNLNEKTGETKESRGRIAERMREIQSICAKRDETLNTLRARIEEREKHQGRLVKTRGGRETTRLDKLKDALRDINIEENTLRERQSLIETQIVELNQEIKATEHEIKTTTEEKAACVEAIAGLQKEKADVEKESARVIKEIERLIERRSQIENEITTHSEEIGSIERSFERVNEQINQLVIEKTKNDTQLEALNREYEKYKEAEILEKSMKDLKDDLDKLSEKLGLFGSINMRAIETFEQVRKEYEETYEKLDTLKKERQSIFDFMDKIEQRKYETFMKTFEVVKNNFERIFNKLSEGSGTLTLDNPANISESGLLIRASPGGKKVMSLDSMSGGEKVLTSAAFLLAVQQYKPSDFYIIDELDAALDKINSIKLTEMLQESETQFILVTHNDSVLRYVGSVIGVSMTNGVSQIVGVKLANA
jgi:chromosome segregation protein